MSDEYWGPDEPYNEYIVHLNSVIERLEDKLTEAQNNADNERLKADDSAARNARLLAALKRATTYVELTYSEEQGEEAAEARHDLELCRNALAAEEQK